MADEEKKDREEKPSRDEEEDSALGNLPPLSDFDSRSGFDSDGGLPPLRDFESDSGQKDQQQGGQGEFGLNTPQSSGDEEQTSSFGFQSDAFSSGSGRQQSSGGFQDFAADSDFSPETPELGPGPNSDMDTPMFDSAFGGGGEFDRSSDTPAPTQAMETPMFGADQGGPGGGGQQGGGFDAFGGGGSDYNVGTPPPDFSPDTGFGGGGMAAPPAAVGGGGRRGGGAGWIIAAILALIIGFAGGAYLADQLTFASFLPTQQQVAELNDQIRQRDGDIRTLNSQLDILRELESDIPVTVSFEERDRLQNEIVTLTSQVQQTEQNLQERRALLNSIERDVEQQNELFVETQEAYDHLQQQLAISHARQRGLVAEVERLTYLTGELEDANRRRAATHDALVHSANQLVIQIRNGMPLTPEKFDYDKRVAAAEELLSRLQASNWVTPALMNAYTNIYLNELEISQAREYFFARVRVTDEFGNNTRKWAECLMLGNWGVHYRTLDGKNIGTFTNMGSVEQANWGFMENLPKNVVAEIEGTIFASRVPGFEEKIQVLAERELIDLGGQTTFQRIFSSL